MPVDYTRGRHYVEAPLTVIFRKKTGEGTYTDATVGRVLQREIDYSDVVKGEALLDGLHTTFHLWEAELPAGMVPYNGDQVVTGAGSEHWVIRDVKHQSRRVRYRCVAKLVQDD